MWLIQAEDDLLTNRNGGPNRVDERNRLVLDSQTVLLLPRLHSNAGLYLADQRHRRPRKEPQATERLMFQFFVASRRY